MRLSVAILFIMFHCLNVQAQANEGNTIAHELWPSFEITKEINKHWSISSDQELRLINNLRKFEQVYMEPGVTYTFNKPVELTGSYRLVYRAEENSRHRFSGDITYTPTAKKLHLDCENRLRYQRQFQKGSAPANTMRYRFMLQYNNDSTWFRPMIGTEFYFRFRNTNENGFNRARFIAGTEIVLSDMHAFTILYMTQHDRFDSELAHVYRVEYALTLGPKKKK